MARRKGTQPLRQLRRRPLPIPNRSSRNVKLRVHGGDRRPGAYKEWCKEVTAACLLYNADPAQLAVLVYLALEPGEGKPR